MDPKAAVTAPATSAASAAVGELPDISTAEYKFIKPHHFADFFAKNKFSGAAEYAARYFLCDEERVGAPAPGADCPADALVCREPRPAAGVPGSFYLSSARIILIINPRVCVCVWYTLSSSLQI